MRHDAKAQKASGGGPSAAAAKVSHGGSGDATTRLSRLLDDMRDRNGPSVEPAARPYVLAGCFEQQLAFIRDPAPLKLSCGYPFARVLRPRRQGMDPGSNGGFDGLLRR